MKLLLFDKRYSGIEKSISKSPSPITSSDSTADEEGKGSFSEIIENDNTPSLSVIDDKYLWGIWQCDDEVTLLLNEEDYKLFPEGSLIISPQSWRVIKLGGRPIEFDETGIVNAMSRMEVNVSTLNISTATSNSALVPENQLESAISSLSNTFHCPVHR
jgi:hypothetical protein